MQENTTSNENISYWKGQDITLFQEDLQNKVNGRISEKSFYSYFKNDPEKLPRIDILNILSQYCGYINWNDFRAKNTPKTVKKSSTLTKKIRLVMPILFLLITGYFFWPTENTFSFCFIDSDRNIPITNIKVDIIVLNDNQSPYYQKSDSLGCFQWTTKDSFIHFVVKSPYHKTDTIYRTTSSLKPEPIEIRTDDYALMLNYYANGKVEDWENRRRELHKMISDNAMIFEILPSGLGIEIYSKNEFIDKLTIPTRSLKAIEIIESQKYEDKIAKLKFRIQP